MDMKLPRLLPRFRHARKALDALAERETWARSDLEAFQLDRLNELWRHATRQVPYYRQLRSAGMPEGFSSLEEFRSTVPILPKARIRETPSAFLADRRDRGSWQHTGGSTGRSTKVFWSHRAHRENLWGKYRLYGMWGVDVFDRMAFVWGHEPAFIGGLEGALFRYRRALEDWLRNRVRMSAYELGDDQLRAHLSRIARAKPKAIYTYSTTAYLMAMAAEATGFRCESLDVVFLTAEPAYPRIVETVERAFRVPAVVEYGSIECGHLAGEWPDRTLRVRDDSVLLETLPRDDGHYDIVVTVLGNPAFPLFRYAIDDITDAPLRQPEKGFATLANVVGRVNDLVRTRSGRYVHPLLFEDVFDHMHGVRRYRVHQDAQGAVSVLLELDAQDGPSDTSRVERLLADSLEGYPITITIVDEIPSTAAGKHRWIVSDLTEDRSIVA